MRWLPFLSRVAFICNLFFLLSVLLQWKYVALHPTITSTIIITGLFLAPFVFNPLVNLFYLLMLLRRKGAATVVPTWLMRANFIFLLLQTVFALFFLYDPFHHQG
jgi:ABC-type molybdate transport system permease subunit